MGICDIAANPFHWNLTSKLIETLRDRAINRRIFEMSGPGIWLIRNSLQGGGQFAAMCSSCHTVALEPSDLSGGLYLVRGLLRPVACTTGGYGVFEDATLQRLCFVRAAFEAGIGLDTLKRLCRALDAADGDRATAQLAVQRQLVERRREALASLDAQLAATFYRLTITSSNKLQHSTWIEAV